VPRWVLGIESSCDETAAAVVSDCGVIRSSEVSSQIEVHHAFGGVVPELASRQHILNISTVVDVALREAQIDPNDLDGIAVTSGPGLVGALLVGIQFAKAMAWIQSKPLFAVDHLLAHLEAVFLKSAEVAERVPPFPHVALLVSGGHTIIGVRASPVDFQVLGATRDDAAGEAFDKFAKILGLGYPGGRLIDTLAEEGNPRAVKFPRGLAGRGSWDFSFSGLKTSAKLYVEQHGAPADRAALCDLCASFQAAVVDVLDARLRRAVLETGLKEVVVAGGVAANGGLRAALRRASRDLAFELYVPPIALCTDNAAMVAMAGQRKLEANEPSGMELNAQATWSHPLPGAPGAARGGP
jgi:N6-L-threonylcarbamoyladenine synthase